MNKKKSIKISDLKLSYKNLLEKMENKEFSHNSDDIIYINENDFVENPNFNNR